MPSLPPYSGMCAYSGLSRVQQFAGDGMKAGNEYFETSLSHDKTMADGSNNLNQR
jgi:hypothetical protein